MRIKTVSNINGIELPITSWRCRQGSYGSIGSASFSTSRKMLTIQQINLLDLVTNGGKNIPADIYVQLNFEPVYHYFGGWVDGVTIDYDNDGVEITARDYASEMVDSRRVLNLKEYTNRTPSQIAEALATDFKLTPIITPTPGNVLAGSLFNRDAVLSRQMRPVWTTLVWLAQQTGFQVYVTPARELVFCPIEGGSGTEINFVWKPKTPDNPEFPDIIARHLKLKQSIKRNRSFHVKVLSYHPKTTKTSTSEVVIFGETITTKSSSSSHKSKKKGIGEGYWRGTAGKNAASVIKQRGLDVPTYTFYYSGLTPDQCKAKAESIAENIAHKLFTVDLSIDGRTDLLMHQPCKLVGDVDDIALDKRFFITSIDGQFTQPSGGGEGGSAGFMNTLVLNTLPPTSTEDPGSMNIGG